MPLIQEGGATEAPDAGPFVEDHFATTTWIADGASQAIVNNINMAAGSLLITRRYDATPQSWRWAHSSSINSFLVSDSQAALSSATHLTSYDASGFTTTSGAFSAGAFISHAFLEAPGFMQRVTYTGNGSARQISHSLGVPPAFIIIKCTSATYSWVLWSRNIAYPGLSWYGFNGSNRNDSSNLWGTANIYTSPANASYFNVGTSDETNLSGASFVAYIFADQGSTGFITANSLNTDSGGAATVSLGWEPQFVMYKEHNIVNWQIWDMSQRATLANDFMLSPNSTSGRANSTASYIVPTADGFKFQNRSSNTEQTYLAVRKGLMRKPTAGSQILGINSRTGTGAAANVVGWAPHNSDIYIIRPRTGADTVLVTREQGMQSHLYTDSSAAAATSSVRVTDFLSTGFSLGTSSDVNQNATGHISYAIKNARGFSDLVKYKGTGAAHTEKHNLNAVPRLIIVKNLVDASTSWMVQLVGYHGGYMTLNSTSGYNVDSTVWNNTAATLTDFTLGTTEVNTSTKEYQAMLFTNRTGVCKIDVYTGNGSTQNIDCGFVSGARFVLIKAVSTTGDWMFFDTTRGIISGNDPMMKFNANTTEATGTDYLAPYSGGFGVNNASLTNTNAVTFMYMAIA
jgi:hypothetical protein